MRSNDAYGVFESTQKDRKPQIHTFDNYNIIMYEQNTSYATTQHVEVASNDYECYIHE